MKSPNSGSSKILATEQSALADADRMDKSKPGVEGP